MKRHPSSWVPGVLLCVAFPAAALAQDTTRAAPFQLHGFLEVYYRDGDATTRDGYRLRKADIKFSGDISRHIRWRLGFDASKALTLTKATTQEGNDAVVTDVAVDQRSRWVQDAALTVSLAPSVSLDIGQQIIPMSLEGTIPTSLVETVERTLFIVERSRGTGLGDVRDIGASLNSRGNTVVEYHVGLFNETGEGQNTTDPNDQKALVGRVAFHPAPLSGFSVGGSGAFEGGPVSSQRRERYGAETQYKDDRITLRTEFIGARDGELRRFGWYGLAAVHPTHDWQLSGRLDNWDRDRGAETSLFDAFERQLTLGASYLVDGGFGRVVANVVHATYPLLTLRANNFALVAFEAAW